MKGRGTAVVLAAVASLMPLAAAAESFVGASLGQGNYSSDLCFGAGSCDKSGSAWSVRAGYALPVVSVEARYFDLGRARSTRTFSYGTVGGSPVAVDVPTENRVSGLGAGVQAALPVLPFFALTALAGISRVRTELKVADATLPVSGAEGGSVTQVGFGGTRTSTQPYYGVGLRFTFAPGFDASLDAQRYRADFGGGKADVDFYGVGLTYRY